MIINDPNPSALSPCPFCGGGGQVLDLKDPTPGQNRTLSTVICTRCGAHGPMRPDRDQAVKGWNTRHDHNTGLTIAGGLV